jgi:hypothetical protein
MLNVHRVVGDNDPVISDSPLTPLAKACLGLAGVLAVLLIAVVVNYVTHGGTEALNPVAQAAEKTAAMPGGTLSMTVIYGSPESSKTVEATGSGIFDTASNRAILTLDVPGADGNPVKVESVSDKSLSFTRSSVLSEQLPPGKEWLGMDPLLGQTAPNSFGGQDGAQGELQMLRGTTGSVEKVGGETIDGEQTTQYKAELQMSQVAAYFAREGNAGLAREYTQIAKKVPDPMPIEVWIDEAGLLRRLRMVETVPTTTGKTLTMDITMDMSDFAAHPGIKLPPSSQVLDYTPVLRAELGMMDGTTLGPLTPPAGAKPLSVATFRHRVIGVCKSFDAQAEKQIATAPPFAAELRAVGREAILAGAGKPIITRMGLWYEDTVYRPGLHALRRLIDTAPPTKYADQYRRYLTQSVETLEWALASARAYEIGALEVPGKKEHEAGEARHKRESRRLAAAMGLLPCERDLGPAIRSPSPSQPA